MDQNAAFVGRRGVIFVARGHIELISRPLDIIGQILHAEIVTNVLPLSKSSLC